MDFGLREWLLILGPVFIIIVLVHGYIRMRASRNSLKMALDKDYLTKPGEAVDVPDENDIATLRAELPNGGARIRKVPEQGSLDLDEDVPVLMEPVEMGHKDDTPDEPDDEPATVAPASDVEPDEGRIAEEVGASRTAEDRPEHYVVLYVATVGEPFEGQALLESLVELDMQFGEMDIFHRLGKNGRPVFSLVNAVEPGTFDLSAMAGLQTPAVSLFMRAHEVDEPLNAYNQMVEVARSLADELGGEIKDASRSVLTPQTIEHGREEIRAYQHKYC